MIRGFVGFLSTCFLLIFLILLAVGSFFWMIEAPSDFQKEQVIYIDKGSGVDRIATDLQSKGILHSPFLFKLANFVRGTVSSLKYGEYRIPAFASISDLITILNEGQTVVHSFTLIEGETIAQALVKLNSRNEMVGPIEWVPSEGMLRPQTYHYSYGEKRSDIIKRLYNEQKQLLNRIWEKRDPDLPLKNPQELLTLASIIEKETAVENERRRVAAVFINRLRLKMPLQSDPTVLYGLRGEQGQPLDRSLTTTDLRKPHPHNTYVIPALPPSPICNPGEASLRAAAHPDDVDDLYFVADGSGGHAFAKDLRQHNLNVLVWRRLQAEKRKQNKEK